MAGMNNAHRRAIGDGLRAAADRNRCPVCGRGAAILLRRVGDRHRCYCRWIEKGLCPGGPDADSWAARAMLTPRTSERNVDE